MDSTPVVYTAGERSLLYEGWLSLSNQHSLNPWLFFIFTILTNRDFKRAQSNKRSCNHRLDGVKSRADNHRQDFDTLGRDNTIKRGPKVDGEETYIPSPHGYSNLKSGVTCTRSRNVITLSNGVQCLEGSATHLKHLST